MRLEGEILKELPFSVIFKTGKRRVELPKSQITLVPLDYLPGPKTIYLPGWLAERKGLKEGRTGCEACTTGN